ncbi:hypothetical protein CDD83_5885 [Cordyceps sp. RAO-2017]|nr:hypothetical protein CDD83_5885 [Cordyceps sp. RAO-2017]
MNALANHGFIPHSGRKVNLISLIIAAFQGLGTSPEVSGIVGAVGFASSRHPLTLTFDLEDLSRHNLLIEHDCSWSREDAAVGDNNKFDPKLWEVVMNVIGKHKIVTPWAFGKAKSARIKDERTRNKHTVYGPRAAAIGAIEAGMMLSAMGLGFPKLEYVRSLFEEERLPTHLGWKPIPEANNVFTTVAVGLASLAGQNLIADGITAILSTPSDIIAILTPGKVHREKSKFLVEVSKFVSDIGFNSSGIDELHRLLETTEGHRAQAWPSLDSTGALQDEKL